MKPPGKRAAKRTPHERDQLDLIAAMRGADARLCEAIVTVFSHSNGRVLVAFGELLSFVAMHSTRGKR